VDTDPSCHQPTTLAPSDRLSILHRKRLSYTYIVNAGGARELRIDYGVKEVSFDDERFFPFGEQIVRELTFTGEQATTWGPGYAWDEIQPLLEALVDEGILHRGDHVDDPRGGGLVPSRVPPSTCPVPRFWTHADCEAITRDLTGHAVEIGYLETFVTVFRIAHAAIDADDRQVGEANVYPGKLRLDRPTEWRVCQYAGSRYRDPSPMNVTALRAMIKYWKPIMALTVMARAELAGRLAMTHTPWTIGELHTMSCVVLALPAYLLQRGGGVSPQPPLHPVLSSLFRITDGIRMTAETMIFSIEYPRSADEPLSAAALYGVVEDRGVFIGDTGVCAGPKPLIDEFLATAVDGTPPEGIADLELAPELSALVAQLPSAVDYGLLGIQSWAVSRSVWLAMSRAYQGLAPLFDRVGGEALAKLRARLRGGLTVFTSLQIISAADQQVHFEGYRDGYERSWHMLPSPVGPATLVEALAVKPPSEEQRGVARTLRQLVAARLAPGGDRDDADQIADILARYLEEEAAVLAATAAIQDAINHLLDRPAPTRPLTVRDFRLTQLMAPGVTGFPYLLEVVDDELGIAITSSSRGIEIADRRATSA
jgi:hypothetical protein